MAEKMMLASNLKEIPTDYVEVERDKTHITIDVQRKTRGRGSHSVTTRYRLPFAALAWVEDMGGDTVVSTTPAPARRGRKPKTEVVEENPAPKKRGRPAKVKTVEEAPAPKKRGRPAKVKTVEEAPAPKKRGRPAKVETTENPVPKKRGRPPKVKVVDEAAPAVDADDEGGKANQRKKAAAEWNSSFKPEQVKPEKPAKPEKPKVRAAPRPFSGEEYSLDD